MTTGNREVQGFKRLSRDRLAKGQWGLVSEVVLMVVQSLVLVSHMRKKNWILVWVENQICLKREKQSHI